MTSPEIVCPFTAYEEGRTVGWNDARKTIRSGICVETTNPYRDGPCKDLWRDGYLRGFGIVISAHYKASLSDPKISWSKEGF
jgi:hypothetical protein